MPVKRRKRDINENGMLIICYDSLIICQRCLKESFRVNYMIAKTNYILSLLAITTQ
jgi:hypothetical protein